MARAILRQILVLAAGVAFWLALASVFGVPFQQERSGPAEAAAGFEQTLRAP